VLVSVCIPAYESVPKLSRAINSVLQQSDVKYEIIVSDDSSTLCVKEYVADLGEDCIKYHKNRVGNSSTANWNNALSVAEGEILILLHHDDYFLTKTTLSRISCELIDKNMDIVWSSFENEVGFYRFFSRKFYFNIIVRFPSMLYIVNYLSTPSCMAFKSSVTERYDENLKWYVDVEFYARCLRRYNKSSFIQDSLIGIGRDGRRISDSIRTKDKLDELIFLPKSVRFILRNWIGFTVMKSTVIGLQLVCFNVRRWLKL
jgi:glycosyltransferase involved in cell wall biosynthesis